MDKSLNLTVTTMEGDGFYNRHSAMQAAGIARVLPIWEKICASVPVGDETLAIADYGSSQGRNSMAPMRVAIAALRSRAGPERVVEVIHTDLPANDFSSLFLAIAEEPESYMKGAANVFPCAIGRSYFDPVIAPGKVHLGWNSWTLHWLSRNPVEVGDHILAALSDDCAAQGFAGSLGASSGTRWAAGNRRSSTVRRSGDGGAGVGSPENGRTAPMRNTRDTMRAGLLG